MAVHKMKLQPCPFLLIMLGSKDIEMRLYDEKRQKINVGDTIEFENAETKERLLAKVIGLHKFDSFYSLYKAFDKQRLGYSEEEAADPNDMEKYYPVCEILKYGVVGIEIKLI